MGKFKLGSERREIRTPWNRKSTPSVYRKRLEDGVDAEANNDGSIFIDPKIKPGTKRFERTIKHEAKHLIDMETGRAAYGDDWVMWEGKIYIRKTIDGERFIDGPAGRLPEGHPDHPWEQSAIKAETDPNVKMEIQDVSIEKVNEDEIPEPGDSPNKFALGVGAWAAKKVFGKKKKEGAEGAAIGEGEEPGSAHSHDEEGNVIPIEGGEGGDSDEDLPPHMLKLKEKLIAKGKEGKWEKIKEMHGRISGGGGLFGGGFFSDRRLKKDIKLIGESPSGLNIYTFKYVDGMCDNNTYEGVMSDEIPSSAIIKNNSGYDMVDYSQLDVDFKKI